MKYTFSMIKQDYLLRMITEILTLLADALLNKRRIKPQQWVEYDTLTWEILGVPTENLHELTTDDILNKYETDPFKYGKIELAAMTMLKISEDMNDSQLVLKSRLQQDAIVLLENVNQNSKMFSLQRDMIIKMYKH